LGTLAESLGIDAKPLFESCAVLDVEPARFSRIAVSGDFDAISLWVRWPIDPGRQDDVLSDLVSRDRLQGSRVKDLLLRWGSTLYVEYALAPSGRVGTALHAYGLRSLADDLELLESMTHVGAAIDRLGSLAKTLAGDESAGLSDRYEPSGHHSWLMHAALAARTRGGRGSPPPMTGVAPGLPGGGTRDHETTAARVDRTCEMLGVTMAQRVLIRDLSGVLAKTQTALGSLRVGPGVTFPELTISYRGVRFEHVVRVLQGLRPGKQLGTAVGTIAGALGSEVAHALEITLRNEEPPAMRICVDLEMGRPCRP